MNDDLKMMELMLVTIWNMQNNKKEYSTTAVSARSLRNELDLNEKDRPTTTEVAAKSVNRNIEWWFEDDTTDAGDNMQYATQKSTILPMLYPNDPYGTN